MDTSHFLQDISVLTLYFFKYFFNRTEAIIDIIFICITSLQEKYTNNVWKWCINCLQYLFENILLIIFSNWVACYEITHPKCIHAAKFCYFKGFLEPFLPKVKMNIVISALHTLWIIFKCCKSDYITAPVKYCNG